MFRARRQRSQRVPLNAATPMESGAVKLARGKLALEEVLRPQKELEQLQEEENRVRMQKQKVQRQIRRREYWAFGGSFSHAALSFLSH